LTFYRGPRRFRVFDCANLVACAFCLMVLALSLCIVLVLFPPPFTWDQTIALLRESPLIAPLLPKQ